MPIVLKTAKKKTNKNEQVQIFSDTSEQQPKIAEIISGDYDFLEIGIGGLKDEFSLIVRDCLISYMVLPEMHDTLGMQHAKWIYLHGPTGTGKTFMASQLFRFLRPDEPIIVVSGFDDQDKMFDILYAFHKDASENPDELNVIIFDDVDAIFNKCKDMDKPRVRKYVRLIENLDNTLIISTTNYPYNVSQNLHKTE